MVAVAYGGWQVIEIGWVEPARGNLTALEYIQLNILGERCDSIGGEVPWRELQRNIKKCKRYEYYDPMHNDCAQCPVRKETDKVFAVYWETQKDCLRVCFVVLGESSVNLMFFSHIFSSLLMTQTQDM